ncbi:MAG TPA: hypothetical protein VN923_00690, partial [Thermoanaerobaculia bacterium]|nr:hypothetical protein [Thermoanaerobaculia bacterium]
MKLRRHPLPFAALLLALLAACASTSTTAPSAPPPAAPVVAATAAPVATPAAAQQLADDVRWVRDSAEYRALAAQAYALASRRIDELA